jgi:hypothetical protein
MSKPLRVGVIGLVITALCLAVATVRQDDGAWITTALWILWPVWAVLTTAAVWLVRREA